MRTRIVSVSCLLALVVAGVLAGLNPRAAQAGIVNAKLNWDIGTLDSGNQHFTLTYFDAHVKIASKGIITDPPTKFVDGGFGAGSHTSKVTPGVPDDTLEVDWVSKAGVTGETHIGVNFDVDNLGQKTDVRVISATLTNVSGKAGQASFGAVGSLPIPGPPSISYGKANSADVTLSVADPALVGPVSFSSVEFYKSVVEPPLEKLNAVDFGTLPTTFLLAVPDFSLSFGGTLDILVPGIDPPDWLIMHTKTTWTDPFLSGIIGGPAEMSVETWFAGQLVPEPSVFVMVLTGVAVAGPWWWIRRRRGARAG